MYQYVQHEAKPELPEATFGRYSDEYMFDTGHAYLTWGRLPRAGGWDDQEAAWRDAVSVWLAYYAYVKDEVDPSPERQRRQAQERAVDALFEVGDDEDGDWLFRIDER